MANCSNRCPRCGRIRRASANQQPITAGCSGAPTVSSQLYGVQAESPEFVTCCDSLYGCRVYNCSNRCRFWPSFCHPRWLSCKQLYSCR